MSLWSETDTKKVLMEEYQKVQEPINCVSRKTRATWGLLQIKKRTSFLPFFSVVLRLLRYTHLCTRCSELQDGAQLTFDLLARHYKNIFLFWKVCVCQQFSQADQGFLYDDENCGILGHNVSWTQKYFFQYDCKLDDFLNWVYYYKIFSPLHISKQYKLGTVNLAL